MNGRACDLVAHTQNHAIHILSIELLHMSSDGYMYSMYTLYSWYARNICVVTVQHIRQLQKSAESHSNEITAMNDSLQIILNELKTLSRIADTAAASVQFGSERQDTVAKMSKLVNRMHVLQQVCHQPLDNNPSTMSCATFSTPETKNPDHSAFRILSSQCALHVSCVCFASTFQACCSAV